MAYEYAGVSAAAYGLDYHVEIAKHYYSVPHPLIRRSRARITARDTEIFHRGKRIASHRSSLRRIGDHCPRAHPASTALSRLDHERIRHEARQSARTPLCWSMSSALAAASRQGFRSCVGNPAPGQCATAPTRLMPLPPARWCSANRSYTLGAAIPGLRRGRLENRRERAPSAPTELPLLIQREPFADPIIPLTRGRCEVLIHPTVSACGRSASPPWPILHRLQERLRCRRTQPVRIGSGCLVDREATSARTSGSPRLRQAAAPVCRRRRSRLSAPTAASTGSLPQARELLSGFREHHHLFA